MAAQKTQGMKNLKSRKLYLQVYDEIKNYILQNELQPGDKLPTEMEMCEILGVSRNVLREAIKSLEITGAVRSTPGVGITIQEFSTDFLFRSMLYQLTGDSEDLVRQTLEVRRTLELGFARQAYDSLTYAEVASMSNLVVTMQAILEKNIRQRRSLMAFGQDFYEADAQFHQVLFSKVDNRILQSIIDAVWACDKYHKRQSSREFMELTVHKHVQICDALHTKDFNQFYQAMLFHFNVQYKGGETFAVRKELET